LPLNDRAGDRQAQSRMAAEAFRLGPNRMEAVKNRLTQLLGDTRAFVVDADPDLLPDMGRGNLDQSAGRRKADRIVDDIVDSASETARLAHDNRTGTAWAGKGQAHIAGFAPRFPSRDKLLDQPAQIDRFEPGPSK